MKHTAVKTMINKTKIIVFYVQFAIHNALLLSRILINA